jgi:2-C-methyl-D-erythritol 4-phosphate cytidylyltransferase/2-C-methyl-D-erythritol 2,4-cyclodiphosphate synthase
MFVTAIIAAGGRGTRFGGGRPKQLLFIAGRPILERSVSAFADHPLVDEVVVAAPGEVAGDPPPYLRETVKPLRVVAGGPRRQDSVANAFQAASGQCGLVVIHDAARPFVSRDLIARTISAAAEYGAAVAAMPARDTIKRVDRSAVHERQDEAGEFSGWRDPVVAETLPRDTIFLAQTPQAFRPDVLRAALAIGGGATDEGTLAERAGHQVRLVEGEATNIKITTPDDLVIAEAIAHAGLERAGSSATRAGTGYDLHRLVPGRPFILGGVTIPSERGALGHSDADAVCHAVTDAILGAACRGDIGRHFPDDDPRWKGASSLDLLARATKMVIDAGYDIANVDVTVILEAPKIRRHIDDMRRAVSGAIGVDVSAVSIKAKTNEGLDAIGRGEAVAAHAIAMLKWRKDVT